MLHGIERRGPLWDCTFATPKSITAGHTHSENLTHTSRTLCVTVGQDLGFSGRPISLSSLCCHSATAAVCAVCEKWCGVHRYSLVGLLSWQLGSCGLIWLLPGVHCTAEASSIL
jgi:hypothetical protein